MELTRKDTKMLQALSVLAMLCLHLFDRLEYSSLYTPLIFIGGGVPLTYALGQLSDFCVMGFAFCTGYAHWQLREEEHFFRRRLKGLSTLLISYWVILIVFSIVGIIAGKGEAIPGSMFKFVLTFFLIESYNGAWWYMFTYVLLVMLSPVLMKFVRKYPWWLTLAVGFVIYCGGYYLRFGNVQGNWLFGKIGPFATTLFEYLIGAVSAKSLLFTKLHQKTDVWPTAARVSTAIVLWIGMLYGHSMLVQSLFVAPLTGLVIIVLFSLWRKPEWIQKFFLFIGEHSTNIWLTHMFFYSVLFVNLVFIAKYPILIYLFMLAITVMVSMLLRPIQNVLQKMILKRWR